MMITFLKCGLRIKSIISIQTVKHGFYPYIKVTGCLCHCLCISCLLINISITTALHCTDMALLKSNVSYIKSCDQNYKNKCLSISMYCNWFKWWGLFRLQAKWLLLFCSNLAVLIFPTLSADPVESQHKVPTPLAYSYLTPAPSILIL